MENLSEFWKEVKERVSNPFIFSFVMLWLIYNWKITVAILFMNEKEIILAGHKSIIGYLEAQIPNIEFWLPVGFAALYCILFAVSKEIIRVVNASINRVGSDVYFFVSKNSKVDFELYIQQIRDLETRKKEIDTLLLMLKRKMHKGRPHQPNLLQ
jgi:hypothetical protein